MRSLLALFVSLLVALPAGAQTLDELRAQLEAQERINALLKQRIESLEAQLADRESGIRLPAAAPAPSVAASDPEEDRALERALQRRGSAVLAPGVVELTPSLFWSHSGSSRVSDEDDLYGASVDVRAGLQNGWMLGAGVPYLRRDVDDVGDNSGFGDFSLTAWKSLLVEDAGRPSLVASLRYTAPNGDDLGDGAVPLGDGFHQLTGRLSSVKTLAPVALYGDLSYTYYFDESISGLDVDRSDTVGFGLGASLAVTPGLSLSAELDFAFEDELSLNGVDVDGSDSTVGVFEIGAGVVLSRSVFLNLFGGFGITDDAPDVILGVSLPIRN